MKHKISEIYEDYYILNGFKYTRIENLFTLDSIYFYEYY